MTVDPFTGSISETLNSHVVPDESHNAVFTVMRRFRGPALAEMLAVLGLDTLAQEMLLSRRVSLGYVPPTPEPLRLAPRPSASRTAPAPLRHPHLPAHRQGVPEWGREKQNEKRKADAIVKAKQVITEMRTTKELPPVDGRGAPIPRCTRRIHLKAGVNVRVRLNGTRACIPCDRIKQAWATLRQFGIVW